MGYAQAADYCAPEYDRFVAGASGIGHSIDLYGRAHLLLLWRVGRNQRRSGQLNSPASTLEQSTIIKSCAAITVAVGTKRQIADAQKFGRFRSEADVWRNLMSAWPISPLRPSPDFLVGSAPPPGFADELLLAPA